MASKRSNNQKKRKNGKEGSKSVTSTSTSTSTAMLHKLSLDSDDSTSTRHEQSSQLLRLPLEIREQIYTYLLDARYARRLSSFNYFPRIENGMLRPTSGLKPFNFSLAILRANKQIYRESLHIFHTTNLFVRLSLYNDDIYWTEALVEDSELGFVSSNPSHLSTLKSQTLDVKIIMEESRHLRCQVIFPAVDLPCLIHLLQSMCTALPQWSRDHSIHLSLRHKYRCGPLATENILLEPWRALHGLHQVVVDTKTVTPSYAQSLRTDMMGAKWNAWTWFESVQQQKEMGAAEMRRGIHMDKCSHFANTIAVLEKVYNSAPQYPALKAAGEKFDKAVNRLRLQCELNLILAATKTLAHFLLAGDASDRALDLVQGKSGAWKNTAPHMPRNHVSWYTQSDMAKVLYRRGCLRMEMCFVAGGMEMLAEARDDLTEARLLNPGDKGAEMALGAMERRRFKREFEDEWPDASLTFLR